MSIMNSKERKARDRGRKQGYLKAIDDFVKMAKELKYEDGELSDIDLDYIAGFLRKEREENE